MARLNLGALLDHPTTQKHVLIIIAVYLESRTLTPQQEQRDLNHMFPNPEQLN